MTQQYSPTEAWSVWSNGTEPIARGLPREEAWAMVDKALADNADTDVYATGEETGYDYEGQ